jgi:hypothetical protein
VYPRPTLRTGAGAVSGHSGTEPVPERPGADSVSARAELLAYQHRDLVPVRLAFSILMHKDVPAVLQLLEAIYRSSHRISNSAFIMFLLLP